MNGRYVSDFGISHLLFLSAHAVLRPLAQSAPNHFTPSPRFSKYAGIKSTTATGRQCQRWNQQRPHTHHFGNMSEAGQYFAHTLGIDPKQHTGDKSH